MRRKASHIVCFWARDAVAHDDWMSPGLIRGGVKLRNGCFPDAPLAGMNRIAIIATQTVAQIGQKDIEMDTVGTEVTINYNACLLMPAEFMANKQIAWVAWHSRKPFR